MPPTYTKAQLMDMNNSPGNFGTNWIKNINTIKGNEVAHIYPTGDASSWGRMYVALPTTLKITNEIRNYWNLL